MPITGNDPVAERMQRPGVWASELAANFENRDGHSVTVDAPTPPSGHDRWSNATASVAITCAGGASASVSFTTYNDVGETANGAVGIVVKYGSGAELTSKLNRVDIAEVSKLVAHMMAFEDGSSAVTIVDHSPARSSVQSMAHLQVPSAMATSDRLTARVADWVTTACSETPSPLALTGEELLILAAYINSVRPYGSGVLLPPPAMERKLADHLQVDVAVVEERQNSILAKVLPPNSFPRGPFFPAMVGAFEKAFQAARPTEWAGAKTEVIAMVTA